MTSAARSCASRCRRSSSRRSSFNRLRDTDAVDESCAMGGPRVCSFAMRRASWTATFFAACTAVTDAKRPVDASAPTLSHARRALCKRRQRTRDGRGCRGNSSKLRCEHPCHPARQDLDYTLAARARDAGCLFALDSDAHTTGQLVFAETALAHASSPGSRVTAS